MARFITHTIKYGDTLQSLALEYLEDASRWAEIAILNDLEYPFISYDPNDTTPNVKKIGEDILIEVDNASDLSVLPQFELNDLYAQQLGSDLSLFNTSSTIALTNGAEGELKANGYGDLTVVNGINNLRQAYILALATPLGANPYHPEYGSILGELMGLPKTTDTLQKIRVEVERVLRSDDRTQDVTINRCVAVDDVVYLDATVTPVGLNVDFALNLVFGEGGTIQWA